MTMTVEPARTFLPTPTSGVRQELAAHLAAIQAATEIERLRTIALSLHAVADALRAGQEAASVQIGSLRADNQTLTEQAAKVGGDRG